MTNRPSSRRKAVLLPALVLLAAALACQALRPSASAEPTEAPTLLQVPSPFPSSTEPLPLSTPASSMPAAGICDLAPGTEVTMRVNLDIPDPRCVRVRPDQFLTIVNNRSEDIEIQFGPFRVSIEAGGSQRIDRPFGDYLAWGVHSLQSTPCCGGEIWLDPDLDP